MKLLRTHAHLWIFLVFALFLRFWNFPNSLYFIYDQGRDALVLQKLAAGDITLLGPTSGLQGFFLGPLWYYSGLPGYVLSGGNPYGICLWYMMLSSLSLPLFWWLAHLVFPQNRFFALVTALLLAFIPGSILTSTFIWNPLLSVPLFSLATIGLIQANRSRWWLVTAFLSLALMLQSEFAYAVFFLPVLVLCLPLIRPNWQWKDVFFSLLAIGLTLLPQAAFEVRHDFLMTRALVQTFTGTTQSIAWNAFLPIRAQQLIEQSGFLLVGGLSTHPTVLMLLGLVFVLGLLGLARHIHQRPWMIVSGLALLPYPFYFLWRGNHGYFFWYYLTCHFIVLIPLLVLGLHELWLLADRLHLPHRLQRSVQHLFRLTALCLLGAFLIISAKSWLAVVGKPTNNAGLSVMVRAVEQIYNWHNQDAAENKEKWVVRTYTANVYTEHYDYLFSWYGKRAGYSIPSTVSTPDQKQWYILIESQASASEYFFIPWYKEATAGGHRVRQMTIGVLTLETWQKNE